MSGMVYRIVNCAKRHAFSLKLYSTLALLRHLPYVKRKQADAWGDKKGTLRIALELLIVIWRDYGHLQVLEKKVRGLVDDYFVMRIHLRGRKLGDYVVDFASLFIMHMAAWPARELYDYINDKHTFWQYMHKHGLPTTNRLGNIVAGNGEEPAWETPEGERLPLQALLKRHGCVFCKPADGTQGRQCGKWEWVSDERLRFNGEECSYDSLAGQLDKSLMVEEVVQGHPAIERFHSSSCNTLRLITLCHPGGEGLRLHFACLRIGTGGGQTDNFCNGGIGVRILESGRLAELGWYRDSRRGPVTEHPDSHIAFKDCEIPMWEECVALALKAHEPLKDKVFGVGWDIVVTERGPLFLEANPFFGSGLPQSAGVGFRKILFRDYLPLARKYARTARFPL